MNEKRGRRKLRPFHFSLLGKSGGLGTRAAVRLFRQQSIEHFRILRGAQLLASLLVAQQARDTRQRLQMICASAFGRQKQKHEVDRLVVHCIISDRCLKAREHAHDLVQPGKTAMRDRNALPHASRAQAFTLDERFENPAFGKSTERGDAFRHLLQQLFLSLGLQRGEDGLRRKQVGDFHGTLLNATVRRNRS